MTVVAQTIGNPGVGVATHADGAVKVEFSDGSSLLLTIDYLPEGIFPEGDLWTEGRELSFQEEEAFRFAASCYRVERIALKLIARAEQNTLGLTAKLERRGFDSAVVKAVITRLLDRNLLDNGRYAELWIRSRLTLRKAPSPQWLFVALGKRGIDGNASRRALNKVLEPETEYELLLRYLEQERLSNSAFSLRAQLKHEGFSSETLNRYFDN